MYLIMYKTLLLYKYFGNKELKLCVLLHPHVEHKQQQSASLKTDITCSLSCYL